ncbi:hypothetical protein ACNQF7_04075 [Flavobacterium sp. RSP29]
MKNYKDLHRGQWAELKLSEVVHKLPNKIVSDIGWDLVGLNLFV